MMRIRKAWRVTIPNSDNSEIVFAPTPGAARANILMHTNDDRFRPLDIVVRRCNTKDVHLPITHPIATRLSSDEKGVLLHAYGADSGDVTKAGYRDYFFADAEDRVLLSLVDRGLMYINASLTERIVATFVLTSLGKEVALSMVPAYNK